MKERPGMNELAKTFKRDGFTHNQVTRESNIAIFRRTKRIRGKEIEHFEVVFIRVLPEHIAFGKLFSEGEIYPRSEEWGTYGWTCRDMDAAWKRVWDSGLGALNDTQNMNPAVLARAQDCWYGRPPLRGPSPRQPMD
jgi:hypothetical protein